MFCGWNKILSNVYSCSFRALSKYERRSVHVFELRQYRDLSRHIEEPQNDNLKAEGPKTLFHIRSNLLCVLCRGVFSFLFALRCIFHCVRTCVVWEWHCLLVMATVTKGGRILRTFNNSFKTEVPLFNTKGQKYNLIEDHQPTVNVALYPTKLTFIKNYFCCSFLNYFSLH